jgi:small neutral amino acid transporter SnatA (MarC family)
MKFKLIVLLILYANSINPFISIKEYFLHDEINDLTDEEKIDEIIFYREIEKDTILNSLISGGITSVIGIPMLCGVAAGTITVLPLSIPLIVGSYSITNGVVYMLSRDKKNEMRFRISEDYKFFREKFKDILEKNEQINVHSKWIFYFTFITAALFFYYIMFHSSAGIMYIIICFILFCFIESYLLTMYIEYKKSIQRRETIIQVWSSECNYYLMSKKRKIWDFFFSNIQYEKESGYIKNNKKCNKYKEEMYESVRTPLEILLLMGLKTSIYNFKYFYNELSLQEKVFGLVLFLICTIIMIFVSRIFKFSKGGTKVSEKMMEVKNP